MGRQYTKRLRKMKKDRGETELGEEKMSLRRFTESKWKWPYYSSAKQRRQKQQKRGE